MQGRADLDPASDRRSLPPGVLPSEEAVNGLYGPSFMHETAALAAAIVTTVDRLSFEPQDVPPAPSIKT